MNETKVHADLLKRIDYLLKVSEEAFKSEKFIDFKGQCVEAGLFMKFKTATLSFLKNLYGDDHVYFLEFNKHVNVNKLDKLKIGVNILKAVRDEIINGWYYSVKKIMSAEIFTDFLEMAKYLLDEGFKDPAAVMIGSVLEEHLRFLCESHSIPVYSIKDNGKKFPKKADLLNADLAKAKIYNLLDQKNITAWLDLRNKAAHGNYSGYSKEQVENLYQGVNYFILRE